MLGVRAKEIGVRVSDGAATARAGEKACLSPGLNSRAKGTGKLTGGWIL